MSKEVKQQSSPEVVPEKMHLVGIKVFRSHLDTTMEFMEKPQEVKDFEFGLSHHTGFNSEENSVGLRLFVKLQGVNPTGEKVGIEAEYGIEFHYIIENLSDYISGKANKATMDAGFAATILGISYSTARGIILERMQGTFFASVILPVINPFQALIDEQES